jgi:hypothetical protein
MWNNSVGDGVVNQNTYPVSTGGLMLLEPYILKTVRRDLGSQEYTKYKMDWEFFNQVWAYNWTVSTVNGLRGAGARGQGFVNRYQFVTLADALSYTNGMSAHIQAYPEGIGLFTTPFQ